MEAVTTARKLVYQVGSPRVASQVQPLWRPLVLWGVSNFHTTTNGKGEQLGMNRDLVRTLLSLGWREAPTGDIRKGQPCPGMAQEFGEDVYFTQYSLMSYPRNDCFLGHRETSSLQNRHINAVTPK